MQGSTSFLVHLAACDFCAVQTTADLHLDTLCTGTHRVLNSHLDGTAVSNLTLHLASDVISHDSSVELGFLDFKDIDLNILLIELLQLFLQFVDILSTFTNDNTRTGSADCNGDEFQRALDDNLRNAGLCQALVQILTDLHVLNEVVTEVLATVPI